MKKTLLALLFASGAALAGGTLNRDNAGEPASLDPSLAAESSGNLIVHDLYEGLIARNAKGELVPGVAKSWEVSPDGKTWTFHLRDDAKWSDGSPVTAADFVYAWRRAVDPKTGSTYAFFLYPVANAKAISEGKAKLDTLGVTAKDPHTLVVQLANPTPYFAQTLTYSTTFPLPQKVIEKWGKKWTRPPHAVSNGPYHIVEWTPNARIVAEKSPTYWDAKDVGPDKVIYHAITDEASSFSRYRAGELQIAPAPLHQLNFVRKNMPKDLHIDNAMATYYYGFNLTKPPFKDNPKLRRALSMAVDRKILVDKVLGAGQQPAYNLLPPYVANSKPYEPDWAKWPRAKQIAEAKKLYAEAGYGPNHPLRFELLYNTSEGHKKIAIALASMWKSILGAQVTLVNEEWKVMLSHLKQHQDQMFRSAWSADYNDPTTFLNILQSQNGENSTGYNNPAYDKLLAKANTQQDLKARAETLYQANKMVTDDDAMIPLYHYTTVILIKPNVKGYEANIMGQHPSRFFQVGK